MSDPVLTEGSLDSYAADLDSLEKSVDHWTDEFLKAEATWDELYDAVADSLKADMDEAGRKGDPAEHYITSVCRKQHRVEYQQLRRAKKKLEGLQLQIKAKSQAASARQTQLNTEMKLAGISSAPQPQWSGRRAA